MEFGWAYKIFSIEGIMKDRREKQADEIILQLDIYIDTYMKVTNLQNQQYTFL